MHRVDDATYKDNASPPGHLGHFFGTPVTLSRSLFVNISALKKGQQDAIHLWTRSCAAARPAARKVVRSGRKSLAVRHALPRPDAGSGRAAKQTKGRSASDRPAREPRAAPIARRSFAPSSTASSPRSSSAYATWTRWESTCRRSRLRRVSTLSHRADLGRHTSRLINEDLAQIVADNPDRFVALARCRCRSRSLPGGARILHEDLGFRGIRSARTCARLSFPIRDSRSCGLNARSSAR